MKYTLAVLTTIVLTTIAAAGDCNVACGGKVYADFTQKSVVDSLKLGSPATDGDTCDAIMTKVRANPGILSALRKQAKCPANRQETGEIKVP